MILSQGENYVVTILPWLKLSELGHYSIVFNLGSILPHVFFAPIEESLYVLCGRQLLGNSLPRQIFYRKHFKPIQRLKQRTFSFHIDVIDESVNSSSRQLCVLSVAHIAGLSVLTYMYGVLGLLYANIITYCFRINLW
ncbi:hypothetical protein HZS_4582 [Henneguya salminicola]|nr:hypothetical protein HZS_4582 [Henneguya salminicola]